MQRLHGRDRGQDAMKWVDVYNRLYPTVELDFMDNISLRIERSDIARDKGVQKLWSYISDEHEINLEVKIMVAGERKISESSS